MPTPSRNSSNSPLPPPISTKGRLVTLRIMWAAMLMGEIGFMAVLLLAILPRQPRPEHPQPILSLVSLGMLLSVVPIAFLIRWSILSRARSRGTPNPGAYSIASILFWAGCEAAAFFSLIVILLNGSTRPTLYYALIAMAAQFLAFPSANALEELETPAM